MAFHVSVSDLRMIEWARTYNWAVRFPDSTTPTHFRSWFPATDVQFPWASCEAMTLDGSYMSFSIPNKKAERRVSITLVDGGVKSQGVDVYKNNAPGINLLPLHEWAKNWVEGYHPRNGGVQTLSEACRQLDIIHYDPMDHVITCFGFAVFIDGGVEFSGDSEGGSPQSLQLDFIIAGTINVNYGNSVANHAPLYSKYGGPFFEKPENPLNSIPGSSLVF